MFVIVLWTMRRTSTKYEEMDKESQAWMTKRTFELEIDGLISFVHRDLYSFSAL
jgi:hypothetical protein